MNDEPCPHPDADFYCEILNEVMQTASELARAIGQANRDKPFTLEQHATAARAIERIARTIRRCMILGAKLEQGRPIRAAAARTRVQPPVRAEAQAAPAAAAKPAQSRDRTEPLDTLPPGTVPEIIASLCQDLASVANLFARPTRRRPRTPKPIRRPKNRPDRQKGAHPTQPPNPARAKGSG